MPEQNRVTPTGAIAAIELRGAWMGNRGSIHRGHEIVRRWQTRRWITCALSFRGWQAPMWEPHRWTPLFFHDEAVALAAGHRPCALCRRPAYRAFQAAWPGGSAAADAMDGRLHADRVDGTAPRRHRRPWSELPVGAFVWDERLAAPAVVLADSLRPWTAAGYGTAVERPSAGTVLVLTPAVSVDVLLRGYPVQVGAG